MRAGADFDLAHCPAGAWAGPQPRDIRTTPRVVGGHTPRAAVRRGTQAGARGPHARPPAPGQGRAGRGPALHPEECHILEDHVERGSRTIERDNEVPRFLEGTLRKAVIVALLGLVALAAGAWLAGKLPLPSTVVVLVFLPTLALFLYYGNLPTLPGLRGWRERLGPRTYVMDLEGVHVVEGGRRETVFAFDPSVRTGVCEHIISQRDPVLGPLSGYYFERDGQRFEVSYRQGFRSEDLRRALPLYVDVVRAHGMEFDVRVVDFMKLCQGPEGRTAPSRASGEHGGCTIYRDYEIERSSVNVHKAVIVAFLGDAAFLLYYTLTGEVPLIATVFFLGVVTCAVLFFYFGDPVLFPGVPGWRERLRPRTYVLDLEGVHIVDGNLRETVFAFGPSVRAGVETRLLLEDDPRFGPLTGYRFITGRRGFEVSYHKGFRLEDVRRAWPYYLDVVKTHGMEADESLERYMKEYPRT